MKYDLERNYIATIRDDVPALKKPEQIRKLCVDSSGANPGMEASLIFAQRINNRIEMRWFEGTEGNKQHDAVVTQHNPLDSSDNDVTESEKTAIFSGRDTARSGGGSSCWRSASPECWNEVPFAASV